MGFTATGAKNSFNAEDHSAKGGFPPVAIMLMKYESTINACAGPNAYGPQIDADQFCGVGNFGQRDIDNGGIKI